MHLILFLWKYIYVIAGCMLSEYLFWECLDKCTFTPEAVR